MTCPRSSSTSFQHTAARRRLRVRPNSPAALLSFNTQPPEGGCRVGGAKTPLGTGFNTQPPEGGCEGVFRHGGNAVVSTHSRPKAAAPGRRLTGWALLRFNTQPPEGGCA